MSVLMTTTCGFVQRLNHFTASPLRVTGLIIFTQLLPYFNAWASRVSLKDSTAVGTAFNVTVHGGPLTETQLLLDSC